MPSRLAQPLRVHDRAQLIRELESAHHELFTLRFQATTRQLADVSKVRKARRHVARLRTLLRESELGAAADAAVAPPAGAPAQDEE